MLVRAWAVSCAGTGIRWRSRDVSQDAQTRTGKIERGLDPIGIIRDEKRNGPIALPRGKGKVMYSDDFVSQRRRQMSNFSSIADDLIEVFTEHRGRSAAMFHETAPAAE